ATCHLICKDLIELHAAPMPELIEESLSLLVRDEERRLLTELPGCLCVACFPCLASSLFVVSSDLLKLLPREFITDRRDAEVRSALQHPELFGLVRDWRDHLNAR